MKPIRLAALCVPLAEAARVGLSVAAAAAGLVVFAAIVRAAPPQAIPSAPMGLSSQGPVLGGRVIDGSTGVPLAGAIVSLVTPSTNPTSSRPTNASVIASELQRLGAVDRQIADRNGRFLFRDLTPGRLYHVWAARPGYLASAWGMSETRTFPARVVLAVGQTVTDATIRLWASNAISGTVRDETGEPIVGVFVGAAMRVLVAGVERFAAGPFTRTDDRGAYRLAPLIPGTYVVIVPSIQFSTPMELPVLPPALDALSALDSRAPVAYLPDGRLTTRLPGPVPGLLPGQYPVPAGDAGFVVRGPGSLPPAPARADGQRQGYPPTFYPAALSLEQAELIRLDRGDERSGIDVGLTPVPVFRVSGVIDQPDGATRRLRLVSPGSEELGSGYETASAFTRPDGRFAFLDVPEGRYTLAGGVITSYGYQSPGALVQPALRTLASLTGGLPENLPSAGSTASEVAVVPGQPVSDGPATIRRMTERSGPQRGAQMTVDVAGADLDGVHVQLESPVSLSGRLVIDTPQDRTALEVRSSSLGVVAESAGAIGSGGQTSVQITGTTMDFAMNLRPGEYVLRMFGGTGFIKSVLAGGREYAGAPIDVASDLGGVVVTITSRTAALEGQVGDPDGGTASHAAVICFPTDPARWRRYGPSPDRLRSVPVKSGRYEISLPGGEYFVIAVDAELADAWKDPAFLEAAAARATRVTLAWGEAATQNLTRQDTGR